MPPVGVAVKVTEDPVQTVEANGDKATDVGGVTPVTVVEVAVPKPVHPKL